MIFDFEPFQTYFPFQLKKKVKMGYLSTRTHDTNKSVRVSNSLAQTKVKNRQKVPILTKNFGLTL